MLHKYGEYVMINRVMKMKKFIGLLTALTMLTNSVYAAEVIWKNEKLTNGENTATVTGISSGDRVTVGVFEGDTLTSAGTAVSLGSSVDVKFNYTTGDEAKIFVWDSESIAPVNKVSAVLTKNGVTDDAIFSDNQQSNKASTAVGYKSIDKITGDYEIDIDITIVKKGDNAIMLGDSDNGVLSYGTSSAVLLFNGDNFAVRNGNGTGGYASDAVTLCSVKEGATYHIRFKGNAASNEYIVIIDDGEALYESNIMTARKTCVGIDTLALVSNGRNTVVQEGGYSSFSFYGKNLEINTENVEPIGVYDEFAGLFYAINTEGSYIRGNNGKITADYAEVKDDSAKFFVKDMGDGSYAFVCKSSNNRVTVSDSVISNIKSGAYSPNDNSQHWILEESENYSENNLSYYIKNIESGKYLRKLASGIYMSDSAKSEFVFTPLKEESTLYLVSKTEAYRSLSKRQKFMLESVYSSVAGDMFGRYGGYADWTPKIRMDKLFNEILSGEFTLDEQKTKLKEFLNDTNGFIYSGQANYETVSLELPGSVGCYTEVGEGVEGTYDFWRGTMLTGMKYPVTIYDAEGNKEQTITVYVHNNDVAKHNYSIFLQAIIQIPYEFRARLKTAKIRNDSANSFNGGGSDVYVRLNWKMDRGGMRSTLVHELGHILDQGCGNWASGGGWSNAINMDMFTPSTYGATNNAEDFAEFCRMYFQCYNLKDMQRGLAIIMPERYASFERLRNGHMDGWGLW